jgi:hypothetical protein
MMSATETTATVALAGLATAVGLGYVQIPAPVLHSTITQAFLLVMTLVLFAYSPVVGIAAIALFAILMFHRNVQKTAQYAMAAASIYGEDNIARQPQQEGGDQPYTSMASQPREYGQFKDTYEAYQSPADATGMFPLEGNVADFSGIPSKVDSYFYRPSEDMGDNTFHNAGPSIDEKAHSFAY